MGIGGERLASFSDARKNLFEPHFVQRYWHLNFQPSPELFRDLNRRRARKQDSKQRSKRGNMAAKTSNVGVIGYGMSAHVFHIPFVLTTPGLKLYAVVQRNPTSDSDAAKDHPSIKSYRSAEQLVKDPEVDVVVITTTPEVHYAQAKLALEAGKHVLLEKPATPTAEELEDLINIAKKQNVKLCIFQSTAHCHHIGGTPC